MPVRSCGPVFAEPACSAHRQRPPFNGNCQFGVRCGRQPHSGARSVRAALPKRGHAGLMLGAAVQAVATHARPPVTCGVVTQGRNRRGKAAHLSDRQVVSQPFFIKTLPRRRISLLRPAPPDGFVTPQLGVAARLTCPATAFGFCRTCVWRGCSVGAADEGFGFGDQGEMR